jgi:rhamnose utilization protein RhaD (predicted bifunctional aldolase and dehydrogenase)
MQDPAVLNALRRMSARVGRNVLLTQAAGGNSSVKHGDVLWVKASGTWLADAEDRDIFVPISLSGARAALAAGEERMPPAPGHAESPLRASIETSLHALMPHPVVLHLHSVNTIAWSVRSDARAEFAARLRGLAWCRLNYHQPGVPLAQAVIKALAQTPADVLILGNHGLVVGAATCEEAEELLSDIECRLSLVPRTAPPADDGTLARICANTAYLPAQDPLCHQLSTDPHNLSIAKGGSLYPDHVIFLGPALSVLEERETLAAKVARAAVDGLPPRAAVLIPGKGAVIHNDAGAGARALLTCLAHVVTRLPLDAVIEYLPRDQEQALLDWDAERYRQQMTANR